MIKLKRNVCHFFALDCNYNDYNIAEFFPLIQWAIVRLINAMITHRAFE